jgi:hypothetical protein
MGAELAAAQEALGADLATIKAGLSAEISQLAATVGRALQAPRPTSVEGAPGSSLRTPGMGVAGPHGHCVANNHRGMATVPPPVGGNPQIFSHIFPILCTTMEKLLQLLMLMPLRLELSCPNLMEPTQNSGSIAAKSISGGGARRSLSRSPMRRLNSPERRRRGWNRS